MDNFERDMLNSYEAYDSLCGKVTKILSHFIKYCDRYSQSAKMKSSIRFTSYCHQNEVNFLDMTVRLVNGYLTTDLYTKPVDTHTYLHAISFYQPSLISSLPKAQFIRIPRICTDIKDYKRHASRFVDFFTSRGFKKQAVQKIARTK